MDPTKKAEAALIIEVELRRTLYDVVRSAAPDPQDQTEIASAVLALLVKDMYRQRGSLWLEAMIRSVLQPVAPAAAS